MAVIKRDHLEVLMRWYLVHTKPRQERCAQDNLQRQGYQCYLPTLPSEKLRQGMLVVADEPLFPRYLFIRLGLGGGAKSWAPIRSTKGVCNLVIFGGEPAKVDDGLIKSLRAREVSFQDRPKQLFQPGERVLLTEAPFSGIEGIYRMVDGDRRAMVLIELLNRPVAASVSVAGLRKAS